MAVSDTEVFLPSFFGLWGDVQAHGHLNYWLRGGRGSTKSSFVSLAIVLLVMQHRWANAVVVRKVANTLRDSVFQQMQWAVEVLGVSRFWRISKAPLEMTFEPTGQRILFRGADDPVKLKGTKFLSGYCAVLWFEELDQFADMEEVRSLLNSLRRGGETFWTFYSYNPPKTKWSWVNKQALLMERRADTCVHTSTYLDVVASRPEWLGQPFIDEAEIVKAQSIDQWKWEYLGEVTGTGGSVFENLVKRRIPDEEIVAFDNPRLGVDFGWFPDPWRFVQCEWQAAQRRLLIWGERSANKALPCDTGQMIREAQTYADQRSAKPYLHQAPIWCDSADMTAIATYRRECGLDARPASKGGMRKQSYIWLSGLREIVIDPQRCPLTFEEFALCEYAKDSAGEWMEDFNDGNDHSIDAVRYAMMADVVRGK